MRRTDSFKVDFSKESHLILPFYTLPEDAVVLLEGDDIFIITNGYLFAVSDSEEVDISHFSTDISIRHLVFPSIKHSGVKRYLMKKDTREDSYSFLDTGLSEKLHDFYQDETPFDLDREYVERRRDQGELFFTVNRNDRILSAAYTVKGKRQIVSLATDRREKKKGLATLLLQNTEIDYLFCEGERLRHFYEKRGYRVVRTYSVINR